MADITSLFDVLEKYAPEIIHLCEYCRQFFQVKKIHVQDSIFPENTLYVGTVSQAQALNFYRNFVPMILIEDIPLKPDEGSSNNSILLLHKKCSAEEIISECQNFLKNRNLYLDQADMLVSTLLTDGTLPQIVTTASRLIQNPLVVLDLNFKVLAYSSNEFRHGRQWLQFIERGYCSFEYIAEFERLYKSSEVCGHTPFFIKRNSEVTQECISRLYSHKKHLGYLVAAETHSTFTRLNPHLYALISDITANVTFVQNELEKTLTEYSRDHIILECLANEFPTKNAFLERIRNTEFNAPSLYQVVIIDISKYKHFDPRKDILRDCFTRLFPKTWMLWFQGNVVTVIETTHLKDTVQNILKLNQGLFEGKNLRFGISDLFDSLHAIPQYYRQCLQALHFSQKLTPEQILAEYNTFKCYDLLSAAGKSSQCFTYYSAEFQKLLAYDRQNETNYVETLYQYIIQSKNLKMAASHLFIHKNTVSYRINKIRELFEFDLDNAFFRFQFINSYFLKQLFDADMLKTEDGLC